MNKVVKIKFPENSLVEGSLKGSAYKDAFSIQFKTDRMVKPEALLKIFFTSIHPLVKVAFLLREGLAFLFGFKTLDQKKMRSELKAYTGTIGESIGLLTVLNKSGNELLTGQDDRHLDFRISFMINDHNKESELIIATSFKIKTCIGKVYLELVKPAHKLLMPLVLKRIGNEFRTID